ncbi:MAG: rRNA pseudouridine synthase [Oscillospiraceae bacterium]|nr:rRNA pseudouridine synthase [Oscillospiraceae bacterium]
MTDNVRIDKFISENSEFTRSQTKELIKKGLVKSDGIIIKKSDFKINPDLNRIEVSGNTISYKKDIFILLNKPAGYVCSTDDPDNHTILELLPPELSGKVFPVGRLDKDSEGMIVLTNNGDFSHTILSPRKHIPKFYIVKLAEPFKIKYINLFREGLVLRNGEVCLPAEVRPLENNELWAFIRIEEGKYHQVKRMFASVGNHVDYLFRFCIGSLEIPSKLGIGDYMEIMHKDVEKLLQPPDFNVIFKNLYVHFSSYLINK